MVYGREGSKNYSPTFVDPRGHGGGGGKKLYETTRLHHNNLGLP